MDESAETSPPDTSLEEVLPGGGTTLVARVRDTVRRPVRAWTGSVSVLLQSLRDSGFTCAPRWLGVDDQGREILDYLPGEVGHYPLSATVRSDQALCSAARLLRAYHEATVPLIGRLPDVWQLPAIDPVEVICHSDFAPYNCIFGDDGTALGVIDFDAARPGPRSWDLGYALYRFAPLTAATNRDGFGDARSQGARAARFLQAYGAHAELVEHAFAAVPIRLLALVSYMRQAAGAGDPNFARHLEQGHADLYLRDVEYAQQHLDAWREAALAS